MSRRQAAKWEPAAEILSRASCGEGSLRQSFKDPEDNASQLNRQVLRAWASS